MENYNQNYPSLVQKTEQRSIQFPNIKDRKHPGVLSLPVNRVDTSLYVKTKEEKKELAKHKATFIPLNWYVSNKLN